MASRRARKHPKLARAPVVSVICQARYSHVLALQNEDEQSTILARLQERLPAYPLFARVAQQALTLSSEGIQPVDQKISSFQFSSADSEWVVGVGVDSVSLQTSKYDHFNDFLERWRVVSAAVQETLQPAIQTRFGLRYVDELRTDGATDPSAWSNLLRPEFFGLGSSEKWKEKVKQSYQEWILELEIGRCTVRHGFLPPVFEGREPFYLLDLDCYVEDPRPFDVSDQEALLDSFNDSAHDLFVWSMNDELYKSYGPETDGG